MSKKLISYKSESKRQKKEWLNQAFLPCVDQTYMKKMLFILTMISFSTWAQTPPNDSCSTLIHVGPDYYWYCDSEIIQTRLSSPVQSRVSGEKWVDLKYSLHLNEIHKKNGIKGVKIPNESCAVSFSLGSTRFVKCDTGLYSVLGKSFDEITSEEWNNKVNSISEDKHELSGCTKTGLIIECPDGVYKKDISVSTTELIKQLEQQRENLKKKRATASEY